MTEVIAVANQKGGIGKTTTSLAIAAILQSRENRVLYIDADPQCNGTDTYRAEIDGVGTLYDLLVVGDTDCIQHTPNGDIIAGDPLLKEATKLLEGVAAAYKLREGLKEIAPQYDYIILDTPPALSILLTNALTAADRVVIPLTPDRYGLQGLMQLYDTIKDIRQYTNAKLKVDGLLLVKYSDRTNLAKGIASSLPEYARLFGTRIYNTKIRESVKVREAQVKQMSLFEWAPFCTTAEDYIMLVEELLYKNDGKDEPLWRSLVREQMRSE